MTTPRTPGHGTPVVSTTRHDDGTITAQMDHAPETLTMSVELLVQAGAGLEHKRVTVELQSGDEWISYRLVGRTPPPEGLHASEDLNTVELQRVDS